MIKYQRIIILASLLLAMLAYRAFGQVSDPNNLLPMGTVADMDAAIVFQTSVWQPIGLNPEICSLLIVNDPQLCNNLEDNHAAGGTTSLHSAFICPMALPFDTRLPAGLSEEEQLTKLAGQECNEAQGIVCEPFEYVVWMPDGREEADCVLPNDPNWQDEAHFFPKTTYGFPTPTPGATPAPPVGSGCAPEGSFVCGLVPSSCCSNFAPSPVMAPPDSDPGWW